jgi:hypothetical protein
MWVLTGRVADVELTSDLAVRVAAGDQAKHVELERLSFPVPNG